MVMIAILAAVAVAGAATTVAVLVKDGYRQVPTNNALLQDLAR